MSFVCCFGSFFVLKYIWASNLFVVHYTSLKYKKLLAHRSFLLTFIFLCYNNFKQCILFQLTLRQLGAILVVGIICTTPSITGGFFYQIKNWKEVTMDGEKVGISFVNIPIEIFSSKELTANEKILYGYLSIFKKQCCFQSNEKLAESLGVSEKTITNGLKHLEELNYIFIEYINNNSATRRVYVVFDNPKKLKYLISKGYLMSKVVEKAVENSAEGSKNYLGGSKSYYPANSGEGSKNYYHKIIKYNNNIEDSALAKKVPSRTSKNITRKELISLEYDL